MNTGARGDTLWVRAEDATLHSVRDGVGPAVLCLHGGPGAGHAYLRRALLPLADAFSLISFDQRSVPRPGRPPQRLSLDAHLTDIDRILEAHRVDECIVIGHSWGAVLALLYATRSARRVKAAVLVNLVSPAPLARWEFAERLAARLDSGAFAAYLAAKEEELRQLGEVERRRRLEFIHAHWPLLLRGEVLDELPAHAVAPELRERLWEEAANALRSLPRRAAPCPTLVLQGDHDPTPLEVATRVAEPLGDLTALTVPECGHVAPVEARAALERSVRAFVSKVAVNQPRLATSRAPF